eukprot:TRINITY_DN44967_c0_g1_i2.p1 TRINITY_DN44967_c0_g1~~TRINITY_DN44967_c0_g1_i2.p1  ORF type:complete len:544 (-),score=59.37 TRINITY_DN44967_c0_g1_i2:380-1990(-)
MIVFYPKQLLIKRNSVNFKTNSLHELDRRSLTAGTGCLLLSTFLPQNQVAKGQSLLEVQSSLPYVPVFDSDALMRDAAAHPQLPSEFPQLPELKQLPYQQFTLLNGIKAFLVEDHELPLISGNILFPGGWYTVPYEKMGLATVSCGAQRAGGSITFPNDQFSDQLEQIGAAIEFGASPFALVSSFSCLKGDEQRVMDLTMNLITEPSLPQTEIDLWKNRMLTNIQHRNDMASGVGSRELQRLLYGKESLYARLSTTESVTSITKSDISSFLKEQQVPQGAVIGVVGDFDSEEMHNKLQTYFGNGFGSQTSMSYKTRQQNDSIKIPSSEIPEYVTGGQVYVIDFPNTKTSSVAMGQFGIDLFHPDVFSLDVLSGMLNSFGGKLFNQVRSEQGLAYSISGGWDTPPDHQGLFLVVGSTNYVSKFMKQVKNVLDDILQSPPDPVMLEKAKNKAANTFVFNFASSRQQLQRLMVYNILGLPEDYLIEYQKGLSNVTGEQVLDAARRHLQPDNLTYVVAGPASTIVPELEQEGYQVKLLEL